MTEKNLEQIAWVTGAGRGIGRALVSHLVKDGWTVAVSARTEKELNTLKAECPSGSVEVYPLDVTKVDATLEVLEKIEANLGSLRLVIFNAGTHVPMPVSAFSSSIFRSLMETNFMGVVNGLEAVIPLFTKRQSGHIAIMGSLAGYRGLPTASAYGASKAALINMCEALKPELEAVGVRLTLINPGFVETPLTAKNEFPMPFLIPVDEATNFIIKKLRNSPFEIAFPRQFVWLMKLLYHLPDRLFFIITRRLLKK